MTEIQNTPLPVDERTLLRVLTWLHAGWHRGKPYHLPLYLPPSSFSMGVSMEDYRAWRAAEGAIQCYAQTKSGSRCRNMIAESDHYLTPRMWANLQAQQPTCRVHSSKVATTMKLMSDKNP